MLLNENSLDNRFLNRNIINKIVEAAIEEDLAYGDLTTDNLISASAKSKAVFTLKENGIVAGFEVAESVFEKIDSSLNFLPLVKEGEMLAAGTEIARIEGAAASILKGERIALNFMQRLSGIATKTNKFVEAVREYPLRVVDTRKTTPTLRILEKYAVRVGGGKNHRMGLFDAVMIKDNHLKAVGGIEKAVKRIRARVPHTIKIEVEVESLEAVKKAVAAGADIIMLDNMETAAMKKAVDYIDGRAVVEASGNITLKNIKAKAAAGIDVISIGALTHQINSLDIALDLIDYK